MEQKSESNVGGGKMDILHISAIGTMEMKIFDLFTLNNIFLQ